jgi:L-ribulose-5-phosphate 3-epimerase
MNRSQFIRLSASALALSAVRPLSALGQNSGVKIRKCLKFGMVEEDLSIADKFRLLLDLGFHGVELDSPNNLDKREVLDARDKTGIEIPGVVNSVHWRSPLTHPDAAVRQACVDSMITALHDCRDYGGSTVLLVNGVVNEAIYYDDAYRRSQEEIRKLIPVAEATGIKIAIENVWNNFLVSPVEAARYLDEIAHPLVGWYFDVGNVLRYGWPEQWIRILNKRVFKLDIKEYSRKKMQEEGLWRGFDVELLEGDCNWPAVMRALEEIDYSGGWGSAEVSGGDRNRLLEISKRMDRIFVS